MAATARQFPRAVMPYITPPLPPPPQTQARACSTFAPPRIDGSLTLPDIYDWHLANSSDHRLFVYARGDGTAHDICWPEAVKASYLGSKHIRSKIGSVSGARTPVIAILAASDTITYFTTVMSILRTGTCIAFPISPRNSAAAVAHLLGKVGVDHVLVGREQALIDLANASLEILQSQNIQHPLPTTSPTFIFEELFLPAQENNLTSSDAPYERRAPDEVVVILHSSGSTAFPKPIYWTNRQIIALSLIPWFGDRDLTDVVFSLATMPMYHGMGILQLFWTASCGLVISAFEPKCPAQLPTVDGLFNSASKTHSDIVFCVPSFIEAWANKPDYVKWLATRGGVLYGGGPLNKEAGDFMTSQGVSIFILYGSTEGGIMSPILPGNVGYDWDYFKFPALVTPEMVPYGENTFELVMVSNEFCTPSVLNTKIRGIDSYATSDLFVPHPTKPGYWKIHGRTDDQIMHNTGEKTNPGPLENMLNQDPHVLSCVMFGRERFQAGIIVDPKSDFAFDPADDAKLAAFRNLIWSTVERMNTFAPQHSRLFKEMVLVSKPTKPFTYTAKNTARRQAVISDYEEEISAAYDLVDESTQSHLPCPETWDSSSILNFVRSVVQSALKSEVGDDDDLFTHGCDSLQATWIRNSLLRGLRESLQVDTRDGSLRSNFVYDWRTIIGLATYVRELALDLPAGKMGASESLSLKVEKMNNMVKQYSGDLHEVDANDRLPPTEDRQYTGNIVLCTGCTGTLGAHIFNTLVKAPNVSHIFVLGRHSAATQGTFRERLAATLVKQGLDPEILGSEKITTFECSLSESELALPREKYDMLLTSVTHIVHCAWTVDFNMTLASFEPDIKSLRNLLNLALRSSRSAQFMFSSTIGIFQNVQGPVLEPLPEAHISANTAVGTGYTESKWVSEQIIQNACRHNPAKYLIVRVGQLCGAANGAWNTKEWLPSIVGSAATLDCLPDDNRNIAWIPTPDAARIMIDLLTRDRTSDMLDDIVHLIHPNPTSWSALASDIAAHLKVSLVPYDDWLTKLEALADSQSQTTDRGNLIPAIKLLHFFRAMGEKMKSSDGLRDAFGFAPLRADKILVEKDRIEALSQKNVELWLKYWKAVGSVSVLPE